MLSLMEGGRVSESEICFESLFIDEPAQSLSSLTAALRAFFSLSVLVGVWQVKRQWESKLVPSRCERCATEGSNLGLCHQLCSKSNKTNLEKQSKLQMSQYFQTPGNKSKRKKKKGKKKTTLNLRDTFHSADKRQEKENQTQLCKIIFQQHIFQQLPWSSNSVAFWPRGSPRLVICHFFSGRQRFTRTSSSGCRTAGEFIQREAWERAWRLAVDQARPLQPLQAQTDPWPHSIEFHENLEGATFVFATSQQKWRLGKTEL